MTVVGPGSTETVYRGRSGVAHVQYAVDPVRPWLGRPPWASASLSGALLAGIIDAAGRKAARTGGPVVLDPVQMAALAAGAGAFLIESAAADLADAEREQAELARRLADSPGILH